MLLSCLPVGLLGVDNYLYQAPTVPYYSIGTMVSPGSTPISNSRGPRFDVSCPQHLIRENSSLNNYDGGCSALPQLSMMEDG